MLELQDLVDPASELGYPGVDSRLVGLRAPDPPGDHTCQQPPLVRPLDNHWPSRISLKTTKFGCHIFKLLDKHSPRTEIRSSWTKDKVRIIHLVWNASYLTKTYQYSEVKTSCIESIKNSYSLYNQHT